MIGCNSSFTRGGGILQGETRVSHPTSKNRGTWCNLWASDQALGESISSVSGIAVPSIAKGEHKKRVQSWGALTDAKTSLRLEVQKESSYAKEAAARGSFRLGLFLYRGSWLSPEKGPCNRKSPILPARGNSLYDPNHALNGFGPYALPCRGLPPPNGRGFLDQKGHRPRTGTRNTRAKANESAGLYAQVYRDAWRGGKNGTGSHSTKKKETR